MAELRVRRDRDGGGIFRRIVVQLDGEDWCGLRPGERQTAVVVEGRHFLQARMDWTTSKPVIVDVGPGDVIELETSLPWRAAVDMFIRPKSALVLSRI